MEHNLNIIEIENFFPALLEKRIHRLFYKEEPKWILRETVTTDKNSINLWTEFNNVKDATAFTWIVKSASQDYQFVASNVKHFIELKTNLKVEKFGRILFGYAPPDPSYDNDKYHMTPHVDHKNDGNWKNFLYYLNDNDTNTLFFNQYYIKNIPESYAKQEIVHTIKPIKNKAVIFDRSIYHSGSVSNKDKRMILNIHFLVE